MRGDSEGRRKEVGGGRQRDRKEGRVERRNLGVQNAREKEGGRERKRTECCGRESKE